MLRKLVLTITVAAVLWFLMFSKWTAGLFDFWLTMSISAVILTTIVLIFTKDRKTIFVVENTVYQIIIGIVLAFVLWAVFWLGNLLASLFFDFARPQVEAVYAMKKDSSQWLIALLLLLLIGPAEEFFWRGFVQKNLSQLLGTNAKKQFLAFVATTIIYALVHIWSFNFMLVMAALVAGTIWGFIYWLKPKLLPALILSHAVWDALVFVVIPI